MSRLSPAQIAAYVRGAGVREELVPTMTAIALAESSGNPTAHNPNARTGDNSYGLFQVNMIGGLGPERRRQFGLSANEELFDPVVNATAAKRILDSQGLNAWSVHKSGAYKRFMDQAQQGASVAGATGASGSALGGASNSGAMAPAAPPQTLERLVAGEILGTSFAKEAGLIPSATGTRMAGGNMQAVSQAAFGMLPDQVDAVLQPLLGGGANGASLVSAAGGATNGPIRLGRISRLGEDPLPSTGPHLDVRIQKPDGTYINPATARSILADLKVGGKPLYSQRGGEWVPSFPVTSGYGPRTAPTAGASTYHRGLDFGVPAGTPIEWHGTPGRFAYAGGIGTLELPNGYRIKTLHTSS